MVNEDKIRGSFNSQFSILNSQLSIERKRCIGLSIGALWLVVVSAAFVIWSLIAIGTSWALQTLFVLVVIIVALLVISIIVIRRAVHLPKDQQKSEKKNLRNRFIFIVILEVIACAIVNITATILKQPEIIPSLVLIVVGLHFLPLAHIFKVPRYYITGLIFCAAPIATLTWIPKEYVIGQVIAWYVIPSFGCGFAAILTAAAGLREAWNAIAKSKKL
jgi:hypothetical protein